MTLRRFLLAVTAGVIAYGCASSDGPIGVGNEIPDFKVNPVLEPARSVSPKDFKGKVVVIDYWATWCGPCREYLPHLESLWKDNKDKGLEVMAITTEPSAKVAGFQQQNNFDFPAYTDESKEANTACGVIGYPSTIVVGKDGKVIYSTMGMNDETRTEIENTVKNALQ